MDNFADGYRYVITYNVAHERVREPGPGLVFGFASEECVLRYGGGEADWGKSLTLTPEDVNAAGFGLRIPAGATIQAVMVEPEVFEIGGRVDDFLAKLEQAKTDNPTSDEPDEPTIVEAPR